jgi:hypothetical protein
MGIFLETGNNISMEDFIREFKESTNLPEAITRRVVSIALATSTAGNANTIHLDDMDKHGGKHTK